MRFLALAFIVCIACCARSPRHPVDAPHEVPAAWQSGVTVADDPPGYDSPEARRLYEHLRAIGVRWAALTPAAFMQDVQYPSIRWHEHQDYAQAIRQLHADGIAVMVKPYLWSPEFYTHGQWTGDIAMHDSADWLEFFRQYSAFITAYAKIAEESHAEILCIGVEMSKTLDHARQWDALIRTMRSIYHGALVYAAAGLDEARAVPFWNALDFIGVNAYFSLTENPFPTEEELCRAWMPLESRLDSLSVRYRKKIIFTEAGYRSCVGAACKPWEWAEHSSKPPDMREQALCYNALCECLFNKPWFGGIYWWKYFTDPAAGGAGDNDFTPQNKPAEHVIARWFPAMDSAKAGSAAKMDEQNAQ